MGEVAIEVNDKFQRRKGGLGIAVVNFLSADGGVGYRVKGSRRIRFCSAKTFHRNWKPITDESAPPAIEPDEERG